jgi:hypothetical protein
MTDVTWRAHPVYTSYEVSSDGQVRSIDRMVLVSGPRSGWKFFPGRVLKLSMHPNGYLGGSLSVQGKRLNFEVHRMMCETYHGVAPFDDAQVRHLNGVKTDNRPENLSWGTRKENAQDTLLHGQCYAANKDRCVNGHEFTPENTIIMKRMRAGKPRTMRRCRTCQRVVWRRNYYKAKAEGRLARQKAARAADEHAA